MTYTTPVTAHGWWECSACGALVPYGKTHVCPVYSSAQAVLVSSPHIELSLEDKIDKLTKEVEELKHEVKRLRLK